MTSPFKEFIKIIKTDLFAKNYSIAVGLAIIADWLMMPIFIKYMGVYAPIYLITLYYLVSELSGIIEYYFHNTKPVSIFIILIIFDIIQVICLFIYFISIEYFTYLLMVVFSIQSVLYEIYSIKAIQVMEVNKSIPISKFQSLLLFNKSVMVVIGLIITGIYSLIFDINHYLIIIIICLSTVAVYYEMKLMFYLKNI